jgi:MFS family permease
MVAGDGERAMITGALVLACVSFGAIPLTQNFWFLGAISFIIGLGMGCGQPLCMILSFNAAPPGRSAEVIAMRMAVSYGAHVLVPPVFGAFGAALGLAPVFWTCAMLMGAGATINTRRKAKVESRKEKR